MAACKNEMMPMSAAEEVAKDRVGDDDKNYNCDGDKGCNYKIWCLFWSNKRKSLWCQLQTPILSRMLSKRVNQQVLQFCHVSK